MTTGGILATASNISWNRLSTFFLNWSYAARDAVPSPHSGRVRSNSPLRSSNPVLRLLCVLLMSAAMPSSEPLPTLTRSPMSPYPLLDRRGQPRGGLAEAGGGLVLLGVDRRLLLVEVVREV